MYSLYLIKTIKNEPAWFDSSVLLFNWWISVKPWMLRGTVFYCSAKFPTPVCPFLAGVGAAEVSEHLGGGRTRQWIPHAHHPQHHHCSKAPGRGGVVLGGWDQLWQGSKCYFHTSEIKNAVKQYLAASWAAWKIICGEEKPCQELLICQKSPALGTASLPKRKYGYRFHFTGDSINNGCYMLEQANFYRTKGQLTFKTRYISVCLNDKYCSAKNLERSLCLFKWKPAEVKQQW